MKYLIIIAMIFLMGCPQPVPENKMIYFKDSDTDLCFGWNGTNSNSITNVPCTDKVLKVLGN